MSTEAVKCCIKVRFKSSDSLFIKELFIKQRSRFSSRNFPRFTKANAKRICLECHKTRDHIQTTVM